MTTWQTSTADRIRTLESDHRSLLLAFGAAFVFIVLMFAGGYLSLSAKMDGVSSKIDTLTGVVSDVRSDVAVLKSDVADIKNARSGSDQGSSAPR